MNNKQQFIKVSIEESGVAIVRLDRPKMNALSRDLLVELAEVAEDLIVNPPKAVILWGGERIFAAGAEISEFKDSALAFELGRLFQRTLGAISAIPRVTIAAVSGYALGGGCELALACDLRIASPRAKMGLPEILLGIIPGGGGTQRLSRLVGPSRAKDLIFSGRQVDAEEALRIGLADRISESENSLLSDALDWAHTFASGAVAAQALAKYAIDKGLESQLETGLLLEFEAFTKVFATKDAEIGIKSFFENGPGKAPFIGE